MKLSTKGRYGARAMLDLALHCTADGQPVSLNSIAERQSISEQYLEQIFSALRKSGIVESVRGAQGGYRLGRAAEKISVGDILRALEGSLNPVDCKTENACCDRYNTCIMKDVWNKVNDSINKTVDGISLADLIKEYNGKYAKNQIMYYI